MCLLIGLQEFRLIHQDSHSDINKQIFLFNVTDEDELYKKN